MLYIFKDVTKLCSWPLQKYNRFDFFKNDITLLFRYRQIQIFTNFFISLERKIEALVKVLRIVVFRLKHVSYFANTEKKSVLIFMKFKN